MTTMTAMLTGENRTLHSTVPNRVRMRIKAWVGECMRHETKCLIIAIRTRLGATVHGQRFSRGMVVYLFECENCGY